MSRRSTFDGRIRVMQLVTGAVAGGGAIIVVVFFVLTHGKPLGADVPILSYSAAGLLLIQSILSYVVPRAAVASAAPKLAAQSPDRDEDRLLQLRQTVQILAIALIEGAVFFAAIAYFIERQDWALMLAVAGIILIGLRFPLASDVADWVESMQRRLNDLRSSA